MNRKDFLYQSAIGLAALSVGVSCSKQKSRQISKIGPQTVAAEIGDIRSLLLHLGSNMWCDYPTEQMGAPAPESAQTLDVKPEFKLVWTDERWREVTDRAAKAGISNFTEWLAVHFAKVGIRVNAIAPGFFVTNQNRALLFDNEGNATPRTKKILNATPMERFGEVEELVGATLFLLSEEAAGFITGVVLPIDGGFSAYSGV